MKLLLLLLLGQSLTALIIVDAIPNLHPLDPLTPEEIQRTVRAVKKERPGVDWAFHFIVLQEPPKPELLIYFLQGTSIPPSAYIPRKAFCLVRDRTSPTPNRVVVNLSGSGFVEKWNEDPGKFVQMTEEERLVTAAAAIADPRVQQRCIQMGYSNISLVSGSGWPIGYVGDEPQFQGRRIFKVAPSGMNSPLDNPSAHPMDFQVLVDAVTGEVIEIEELPAQAGLFDDGSNKTGVMTPKREYNYVPELLGESYFRSDLHPVGACQDGVSFTLNGNHLTWQKWDLRLSFNGREGLVLHWVSYNNGGYDGRRPIFYRVSISEMYIPYGDPRDPYFRDNYFDQGESGLGYRASSLNAGEHCIGNVQFLDAVLHNETGQPVHVPRAVCIREEDAGIGWKHKGSVTRRQRLALTFIGTFSHYDYVYTYHLYEDATLNFNVQLTGALGVNLQAKDSPPNGYGTTVAPQINAPYHQHFTLLRVDPDIDGIKNSVVMNDIVPGPGLTGSPENKLGNAFTTEQTLLKTAGEARTNINVATGRTWVITGQKEQMGRGKESKYLSGWQLVPHPSPKPMQQEDGPVFKIGGFIKYNTWVTKFKEGQFYGAGIYAGSMENDLPQWVDEDPNASVMNEDVVVWHAFNMPHIPRLEDWPVMNVADLNIDLRPYNYFEVNPALDVRQANDRPSRTSYDKYYNPGNVYSQVKYPDGPQITYT